MKLWMKVSEDGYELPEIVCGSLGELSRVVGIKKEKIRNEYYYAVRAGKPCRFVRVEADDWADDEHDIEQYYSNRNDRARYNARARKKCSAKSKGVN